MGKRLDGVGDRVVAYTNALDGEDADDLARALMGAFRANVIAHIELNRARNAKENLTALRRMEGAVAAFRAIVHNIATRVEAS